MSYPLMKIFLTSAIYVAKSKAIANLLLSALRADESSNDRGTMTCGG
jgi:hypothetical protein